MTGAQTIHSSSHCTDTSPRTGSRGPQLLLPAADAPVYDVSASGLGTVEGLPAVQRLVRRTARHPRRRTSRRRFRPRRPRQWHRSRLQIQGLAVIAEDETRTSSTTSSPAPTPAGGSQLAPRPQPRTELTVPDRRQGRSIPRGPLSWLAGWGRSARIRSRCSMHVVRPRCRRRSSRGTRSLTPIRTTGPCPCSRRLWKDITGSGVGAGQHAAALFSAKATRNGAIRSPSGMTFMSRNYEHRGRTHAHSSNRGRYVTRRLDRAFAADDSASPWLGYGACRDSARTRTAGLY